MPDFESSFRDSLAELAAANEAFARSDPNARRQKDAASIGLIGLLRANHEVMPLKGFATTKAIDNPDGGTIYAHLSDDRFEGVSGDYEDAEGEWIAPDRYFIGGDRRGWSGKFHTVQLGVIPHGHYEAKRLEVVLDTLAIATPEEIEPAVAERQANLAVWQDAWSRYLALNYPQGLAG